MRPSASKKSTVLNLLAMIEKPASGKILLNGSGPKELNQKESCKFRRKK